MKKCDCQASESTFLVENWILYSLYTVLLSYLNIVAIAHHINNSSTFGCYARIYVNYARLWSHTQTARILIVYQNTFWLHFPLLLLILWWKLCKCIEEYLVSARNFVWSRRRICQKICVTWPRLHFLLTVNVLVNLKIYWKDFR